HGSALGPSRPAAGHSLRDLHRCPFRGRVRQSPVRRGHGPPRLGATRRGPEHTRGARLRPRGSARGPPAMSAGILRPPYPPMEARLVEGLPQGPEWAYEPKWDGFRCLAFREGKSVELQSKSGQSLTRYFPEAADALRSVPARRFVLDGEIVVPVNGQLSFDDLLQRIHPAASRVQKLAREHPAQLVVFDLLMDGGGRILVELPLRERRRRLEAFVAHELDGIEGLRPPPATADIATARKWLAMTGGTFDGVMAKRVDLEYRSGDRTGMEKIKR